MASDIIRTRLQTAFPEASIQVESEDEVHFRVQVIDASFKGLSLLKQHRAVYDALGERWSDEIHAIALDTRAE